MHPQRPAYRYARFGFAVFATAGRTGGAACGATAPRICVYTSTNGAAIATDEYVPITIPTTIANAK